MKRDFPGWSEQDGVCGPCLDRYRLVTFTRMMRCPLCGQLVPELLYDLHRSADDLIVAGMKRDFPGWSERNGVCGPCLERYRQAESVMAKGPRFTKAALHAVYLPV